ncbi:Rrf2 family transcriptional regulator [candidate division KSB1 bacterium]|nr:Rrf2 family transcriptional regulator [candidate division KSB1 bacterium]
MFKLNKKTEYGLLALQYMSSLQDDQVTTAREIAEKNDISLALVSKILQKLAQKKLVRSVQGAKGGYVLAKNSTNISLAEIVQAIEGPIYIFDCQKNRCTRIQACSIKGQLNAVAYKMIDYFKTIKLSDFSTEISKNKQESFQ